MRHAISILFRACLIARFCQRTIYKTILGVHDGCLRVVSCFFFHTRRSLVASICKIVKIVHTILTGHVFAQIVEYLTIML